MMWNKVLVVSVIVLSLAYGHNKQGKSKTLNDNYMLLTLITRQGNLHHCSMGYHVGNFCFPNYDFPTLNAYRPTL